MNINEIAVKELATKLGVEESKLKAELVYEGTEAPTSTKVAELFASTIVMPKKDHETLLDNHGKNKFDEGKNRSLTDLTKLALGEKAFEVTKEMKREDVWQKIADTKKAEWETENGKAPDAKVKELQDSIVKLQSLVGEKESAFTKLQNEFEQTKTFSTKKERVLSAVSSIPFEATGEILSKQREIVMKNVLSSYELKIEEGKDVYYKDNVKLVDALQNPMTIEEIVKGESIIFPTKSASNGRGENSSRPNNNSSGNLDAELKKATTMDLLSKLMTERGLSPITSEGKAVIQQWAQIHKKSA